MKRIMPKVFSLLLVIMMTCSFGLCAYAAAGYTDMPAQGHWSYDALTAAVDNGLLHGTDDNIMFAEDLTRAEMAAIISQAFGAAQEADISAFSDVPETAWYHTYIAKAVQMGAFRGDDTGLMRPQDSITRQEAFTVLAHTFKLMGGDQGILNIFSDADEISSWAAAPLASLITASYVCGSDGKLNPGGKITREEFAQIMYNLVKKYISQAGTYTEVGDGNVMVNTAGVTLKDLTVNGDLIAGDGIGNGELILDNVVIKGRLVLRGGGENSIRIIDGSKVSSIVVSKTSSGKIHVYIDNGCTVGSIDVEGGLDGIILEGFFANVTIAADVPVILNNAVVNSLMVTTENAQVTLNGTTLVTEAVIAEPAVRASLTVMEKTIVMQLNSLASGVTVSGTGKVCGAVVSGDGTVIDTDGTALTVLKRVTGVTENGNTVGGGESVITKTTYYELALTITDGTHKVSASGRFSGNEFLDLSLAEIAAANRSTVAQNFAGDTVARDLFDTGIALIVTNNIEKWDDFAVINGTVDEGSFTVTADSTVVSALSSLSTRVRTDALKNGTAYTFTYVFTPDQGSGLSVKTYIVTIVRT